MLPAATESAALALACNSAQPSPGYTGTLAEAGTTLLCMWVYCQQPDGTVSG